VSPAAAAASTLGVLALAGLLPTLALVGARLVVVPLLPLAGAGLAALAGACCIALAGTLLMWFVVWSAGAAAAGAVVLVGRRGLLARMGREARRELRPRLLGGLVVLLGAAAWALRTLRVPNVGFDARSIWLLHAQWLLHGHAVASADIRNQFFVVSHPSYPPLVSSVMALSWAVTGTTADRVAVVSVALLNGCALVVAGWGVVEAARRGMARTQHSAGRQRAITLVAIVIAVLVVLVAGGVLGVFATNGYADPLWSLAAVGAVLFGLVLEPTGADLGVVTVLLGVAGLAKVEGTAIAIVLLLVIGLRRQLRPDRPSGWSLRPLLAIATGVVALSAWELVTVVMGVPTDPSISGRGQGSLVSRAQGTWDAAVPHLHVVVLAAFCAVLGYALMRTVRQRLGLGNDLWAWVALGVGTAVLGGAYVFGPGNLELWLATSVNRTTIFVALLAWWMVATWAVCASAAVLE
jgi:hypothetical protein